jgi:hypothetical protein
MSNEYKKQYVVNIDFDEASKAWRRNKVNVGMSKSQFRYVCGEPKSNGEPCKGTPFHWAASLRIKNKHSKYLRTWAPCRKHVTDKQRNSHMASMIDS